MANGGNGHRTSFAMRTSRPSWLRPPVSVHLTLLRPHTYSTLLALLAVTGLRISEALALRFKDVTPDGLVIRATKFLQEPSGAIA